MGSAGIIEIDGIPIEVGTLYDGTVVYYTQEILSAEQLTKLQEQWKALQQKRAMHPKQIAHVEVDSVLAMLTDNELCDVLLASYVPISERTPCTWDRR